MITLTTPDFSMPHFDTHKFVKSFVAAKTDEEKAEAVVRVISEARADTQIEVKEAQKDFATKSDLKSLEIHLTNKIYLTTGGLAVFLTGLILGVLPMIIR